MIFPGMKVKLSFSGNVTKISNIVQNIGHYPSKQIIENKINIINNEKISINEI